VFHAVNEGKIYDENQQMHLWLNTLFTEHTYMFWSPSATILRVYTIEEYNKKVCVCVCVYGESK
jgi:hypothetical protein